MTLDSPNVTIEYPSGGYSSGVRAPDCGSGGRGFETHYPPHSFIAVNVNLETALAKKPPTRILVVCREHLGDVVNITGALASLQRRFPDAEFTVELGENTSQVLQGFPKVRTILRKKHQGLPGKLASAFLWRRLKFDLAVILDDSNVHIVLAFLAGIPWRVGIYKSRFSNLYSAFAKRSNLEHDVFDGITAVLQLLGASNDVRPYLPVDEGAAATARQLLVGLGWDEAAPIVAMSVGASDFKKRWPIECFNEVYDRSPGFPVLLYGPGEANLIERAEDRRAITPGSVALLAEVVRLAAVHVSGDSGPAHFACAVDTHSIVIYGPTDPARFHPYNNYTALRENTACDHYAGICAAGNPCDRRCMIAVKPKDVLRAINEFLSQNANPGTSKTPYT